VNSAGDVIVTGYSQDAEGLQRAYTAAYAAADGTVLWEKYLAKPNANFFGKTVAVGTNGEVTVAGGRT